ncbi:MAG: virulence-associated E family protein [Dehalococcoidia bacterium]|nr:virulence-associated E family protein [Dehalococcoidia bacterium]
MAQPKIHIQHDGPLTLFTGTSRKAVFWKLHETRWSALLQKLSTHHRTAETLAEYQKAPKPQQDTIKDTGGFVGGTLEGGRRKAAAVTKRHLITLDADHSTKDLWTSMELLCNYACAIYSTHSHTPGRPRLRLVIPLGRPVTAEEYQAIARRVAADLGIDMFDSTTFEAHRLMYWPSCPSDAAPIFQCQDLPWLDPDTVLARYDNWRDPAAWPEPAKAVQTRQKLAQRQEDPTSKRGVVGTFCRVYGITDAIETFLGDVYEPVDASSRRYTYTPGTTTGGLVVYDDGKYAYSHHGTDPTSGRLVNAFDLVRLHKFGNLDDEAAPGTPTVKAPSYLATLDLATADDRVRQTIHHERQVQLAKDFDDTPVNLDWMARLKTNRKGGVLPTRGNILVILECDQRLAGRIARNEFTGRPALQDDVPWRDLGDSPDWHDRDDAGLRYFMEKYYKLDGIQKIKDALGVYLGQHSFHPIRDYVESLTWDRQKRLDTLLIDYLGAADSPYVRAVTRKSLTSAITRIMRPGCKVDYTLTLVGPQGIGKSLLLKRLGRQWFSDSLPNIQGKEAYEQLQGAWIIELGELAATRRADLENIKHFLTKQSDRFRVAYGYHVTEFPRQCVFFATTNDPTFLRDRTGSRRFWPVAVSGGPATAKNLWRDLTDLEVDQVWAEAIIAWKTGEPTYLSPDLEAEARWVQETHTEESERTGGIRDFLELKLPANWDKLGVGARREYIHGNDFGERPEGVETRSRVCVMEIWVELFNGDPKTLTQMQAREIHDILRSTPGWEPHLKGEGKLRFGNFLYGKQRAYVRIQ